MSDIHLVATVHKNKGRCNVDELLKIVKEISPEVIFGETSTDYYSQIKKGNAPQSVEILTFNKYSEKSEVNYVPVDKNLSPGLEFKKAVQQLFDIFNQYPEYYQLQNERKHLTIHHGFEFLNSDKCQKSFEREHQLEKFITSFRSSAAKRQVGSSCFPSAPNFLTFGKQLDRFNSTLVRNILVVFNR